MKSLYLGNLLNKSFHIGIAGNIGAGKTTMATKLADQFGWEKVYESVVDNPYLSDFYDNMDRWSFNLQVYFLYHRFSSQNKLDAIQTSFIQDRTIYEDKEIFARNLRNQKLMSERDWKTYKSLFDSMIKFINEPDLIIYLKASTDTLLSRIENRNRVFEKNIDPEYIHSLNIYYDQWIKKIEKNKKLIINTDNFNIFTDKEKYDNIVKQIQNILMK